MERPVSQGMLRGAISGLLFFVFALFLVESASAYSLDGRKWGDPTLGTPGAVSVSVMPAGVYMSDDRAKTTNFFRLCATCDELSIIHAALDLWASATGGSLINLGTVSDNGAPFNSKPADPQGLAGPFGDIRLAAVRMRPRGVLAHAYYPPPNGTSASGDAHFNNYKINWVDDPNAGSGAVDFFTVALHELGHSLGLRHSNVEGSVMWPYYTGPNRTLTADDIAGIIAIYGYGGGVASAGGLLGETVIARIPEPATLLLLGSGLLGLGLRRRRMRLKGEECGNSG
jgi:hypothetical protein